jgi:hypothetical protein
MANDNNITVNDSSGITSLVFAEYIAQSVGEALRDTGVLINLCDIVDISGQPTLTASFPTVTGLTASALSNNYDTTSATQFVLTDTTAAATERTVAVEIADTAAMSTNVDIAALIVRDMTAALLANLEAGVAAVANAFTANSQGVGTSAAALTWANMIDAFTNLRINAKQLAGNAVYGLYPTALADLITESVDKTNGLASGMAREDLYSFFGRDPGTGVLRAQAGTFMGLPVITSTHIPALSTVNSANFLMVVGQGIGAVGCAMKWSPKIKVADGTANKRNSKVFLGSVCAGFVEKRDALGVTMETVRA